MPHSQIHNKILVCKGCLEVIAHVLPEARITSKCSDGLVKPSTEDLRGWRFL